MDININTILFFIACVLLFSCSSNENKSLNFNVNGQHFNHNIESTNVLEKYPSGAFTIVEFKNVIEENDKYQIQLFENGLKKKEGILINGQKNGLWKYYYENGRPGSVINYVNDTIDGNVYEIDDKGGVRFVGYQIMGNLEGLSTYFFENGKLRKQGEWKAGQKVGIWNYFNEDGSLKNIDTLEIN